jgi:hypothetical protein
MMSTQKQRQAEAEERRKKQEHKDAVSKGLLSSVLQRMGEGKPVQAHELRAVTELLEQDRYWLDRKAAVEALSLDLGRTLTINSLYEWKRQGAPIPTKGSIDRLEFYRWLAVQKNQHGGERVAGGGVGAGQASTLREQKLEKEIALLGAKYDALSGTMLDSGEVAADIRAILFPIPKSLKDHLANVMVEARSLNVDDAIDLINRTVDNVFSDMFHYPEKLESRVEPETGDVK